MIVDTHLHLIDRKTLRYPWLKGVPALDRDFSHDEYATEARRAGIEAALHMEVDVDPADIAAETAHVEALSKRPGSLIAGAIVSCRPEEPGFPAWLDAVKANPFVKGFRRVLHVVPDDLPEGALFRENVKRIAGSGLTFDLCVLPHQMKQAIALVDLAPDVQFVLDHCGVPDIKAGEYDVWAGHMTEIAKRPNIVGKLSGIVAYTDTETWTLDSIRPYAEHTISSFGFDRMIWGSDWPVCTLAGTLSTWVATTHALLEGASKEEKAKLLCGNAIRLWDLKV
jgi:predicted TIM-barrel fold metal-dependent hydrolase